MRYGSRAAGLMQHLHGSGSGTADGGAEMSRDSALVGVDRFPFNHLISIFIFLALFSIFSNPVLIDEAHAGEVSLTWDANAESTIAGYKLYYGSSSKSYEYSVDVGNTTTYTLTNLPDDMSYYFAATAYDVYGNESDYSEEVFCVINNQPPIADAGPDQTIPPASSVILSATNSYDPDGGSLSYTWKQIQGTEVILSSTNAVQPTFTAPDADLNGETLVFSVTVRDQHGMEAVDTCSINIVSVNLPPLADAGVDQTVEEWAVVMLDGSGCSDPDDGLADHSWEQIGGPSVEIMDADLARPTFVAPNVGPEGASLTFQLTVKDMSGLQSVDTCVVNVSWVNAPPKAEAGPDQILKCGKSSILDGSASTDPDDGIASYQWTQTSGPPVILSDPTASSPTFTAPDQKKAVLIFGLTVTDYNGLKSTDTCTVRVK
jgi:hypothetical protein